MNRRLPVAVAAIALGALVGSAVFSIAVDRWDANRMPSPAEVALGNRALLDAWGESGGVVRTVPYWFADARVGLGTVPMLPGRGVDAWEAERYETLYLAYPTSHAELATAEVTALGLTDVRDVYRSEMYVVQSGQMPTSGTELLWDGVAEVEAATVMQTAPEPEAEPDICDTWSHDAWHCGRYNPFIFVGASMQQMGDRNPHHCVLANAPEAGTRWTIRWTVPANGDVLRWRAGNTYMAVRAERGSDVAFAVRVDDELVHEQRFSRHDASFAPVEFRLPEGPEATVSFEVSAVDHFDRFFCIQPQVVRYAE